MEVAIIPARAGSKSIINKNLQRIGSKSLVNKTIEEALDCKFFDEIILSTDIETIILDYAKNSKVKLHIRPPKLATDESLMNEVVKNIISMEGLLDDRIWLLQPTAAFRRKADYFKIRDILDKNPQFRSLISITDVGANHPSRMYTLVDKALKPIRFASFANKQDLFPIYIRSGHFYVTYVEEFLEFGSFRVPHCFGYKIEQERSVNIDTPLDLRIARMIHATKGC